MISMYRSVGGSSSIVRSSVLTNPWTVASGVRTSWHASETSLAKEESADTGFEAQYRRGRDDASGVGRPPGIRAGGADRPVPRRRDGRAKGGADRPRRPGEADRRDHRLHGRS